MPAPPPVDPCTTKTDANHLVADATKPGTIDLLFYNARGARVLFYECIGKRTKRLGARRAAPDAGPAIFKDAVQWSCDRQTRRFGGVAKLFDGTIATGSYSVRTASCASRFELKAPRRVRRGSRTTVRVIDRWAIGGIRTRLCITPHRARRSCKVIAIPKAVTVVRRTVRPRTNGLMRIVLQVRRARTRAAVAVGSGGSAPRALPTVLAAGDSTMQGIDSFLADELADDAIVRSDVRPGSGVSRGVYWRYHAKSQTKRLRQRVTVFSVGAASDGLPIPTAIGVMRICCDDLWVQEYANRTRVIMRTFLRSSRAGVVWLTPPEPRFAPRAEITHAVNVAVERAAKGLAGVKVIRIDKLFNPHGYSDTARYRGRVIRVRESDGVHLNVAGTAIAAKVVAQAISESGVLKRSSR